MLKTKLLILTAVLLTCAGTAAAQQVVLVRHAEKADDGTADPPLTEDGVARAEALAVLFRLHAPAGVLASPFKRTVDTANPTALLAGLDSREISLDGGIDAHIEAVAQAVREFEPNDIVLVVGHSNTIPAIIGALGGPLMPDIEDEVYDRLFFLDLGREDSLREILFDPPAAHTGDSRDQD